VPARRSLRQHYQLDKQKAAGSGKASKSRKRRQQHNGRRWRCKAVDYDVLLLLLCHRQ